MPESPEPQRCAQLLAALADPGRLRIVRCLRDGPHSVSELADRLQIVLVNVSHHLSVLRHAGIVQSRKQGRHVVYSLAPSMLHLAEGDGQLDLGCCQISGLLQLEDPTIRPARPQPADEAAGPDAQPPPQPPGRRRSSPR